MPGRPLLNTPGPTHIPERILNAMHYQPVDFAEPGFQTMVGQLFEEMKTLFDTDGEVFVYTASGHGAWEAAIVNLLKRGDKILMPETGRFSRVWRLMAEALEVEVETIPNDWRNAVRPEQVEQILRADTKNEIKAVFLVHVETATGVVSDVEGVRRAMDAVGHPAFLVVDAIASFLTTPLPMRAWNLDVVLAASQKGFMLPPGLSFTAVSPRALEYSKGKGSPREYWSWESRMGVEQYRRFCGTPPIHLIWGLREAVTIVQEEGMDQVFARHDRLSEAAKRAVGTWCDGGPLEFNAINPEERCNSVTAIRTPETINAEEIRKVARETFQVQLGGGLSDLAGKVFRLGHLGDLNEPMIIGALGGVEAALKVCQVPHGKGGLCAAVDYLAETA